ncbi:hypothetical protein QQG55_41650 [Brugia pahangi]
MRKRLPKQFEVTRKEIQSKGHVFVTKKTLLVGVTLDSESEEYPSKGVSCYTFATTCASERLELDFLKNRNGEPEMIVL